MLYVMFTLINKFDGFGLKFYRGCGHYSIISLYIKFARDPPPSSSSSPVFFKKNMPGTPVYKWHA